MNEQNPNNNQPPKQDANQQQPNDQQQSTGRKPDHAAYNVQNPKQGGAVWNRIGSAWEHRDGRGFEIDLHSIPVDGRVTVRELRDQAHEHFENQQQQITQEQGQKQSQDQSLDHNNTHGRSR